MRKPRPTKENNQARRLIEAAKSGDVENLKSLVKLGSRVDCRNEEGDTALMYAAAFGKVEALRWLLNAGASVHVKNECWITPLMDASMSGAYECMKELLAAGSSLDSVDDEGQTALMFVVDAVKYQDVGDEQYKKCVALLLQAGCGLGIADRRGKTAGDLAKVAGRVDLAAMIEAERERRELVRSVGDAAPRSASMRV
jgi:ankyrin repeat protein